MEPPETLAPPRRKPVIGLLGGPGSGKSLVARQFAKLGCGVVDADRIAREALDQPDVRNQLAQWWGPRVIGGDGRIDRKAVAAIVFDKPDELRRLEGLLHPKVAEERARLHAQFNADPAVVAIVEDVPLLLEKNLQGNCDVLVFVDAPREARLQRVRQTRGWSEAELEARERNQRPLDFKKALADDVVDNSAGESELFQQVRTVLSRILHERA